MKEMHTISDRSEQSQNVIAQRRSQGSCAESDAVLDEIGGCQHPFEIIEAGNDARQAEQGEWRIIRMNAEPDTEGTGLRHHCLQETAQVLPHIVGRDSRIGVEKSTE